MGLKLIKLINLCLEKNIPFVCFRLPGDKLIQSWVQVSGKIGFFENISDVINLTGFVYAPFHRKTNFPIVFFQPELIFDGEEIPKSILDQISSRTQLYPELEMSEPRKASEKEYLKQAAKIIESFHGDFKKTVLSRVQLEKKLKDFNAGQFFIRLTENYPSAYCHIINIPGAGTWTGATPERLLFMDSESVQTVALAGTQSFSSFEQEPRWQDKEIEEQRIVTDYISEVLNQFKIKTFEKKGPKTIRAGNALHLSTEFRFKKSFIQNQLGDFIEHLHPTPAVCGIPKEKALDLILQTEKHNREYYAGYMGPVNVDNRTELFVNLRCMKILKDRLALFVGGGLTAQSVPIKEWEETELKAETLKRFIR